MATLTGALVMVAIVGCEMAKDSPKPPPPRFSDELHAMPGRTDVRQIRDSKTGKEYLVFEHYRGGIWVIEQTPSEKSE